MKIAFLLGVENVLVSSTDPHQHFIRPGAAELVSWMKARGTVFLNTAMPAATNSGELTLDCQTFLAELGVQEGIRRWSFSEISKEMSVRSIESGRIERHDVARKTTGYLTLAEQDYTIVHVDVPVRPEERIDIETCKGKIVEVDPWAICPTAIKDANTHRDRGETGGALDLGYEQFVKGLDVPATGVIIVHPGGYATVTVPKEHMAVAIREVVTTLLEKAFQEGKITKSDGDPDKAFLDLEPWFLRKIWFVPSDVPMRDATILKRIDRIVIPKIEALFGEGKLQKSSKSTDLNWNAPAERIAKNVGGQGYIENPFGGFPLGEYGKD